MFIINTTVSYRGSRNGGEGEEYCGTWVGGGLEGGGGGQEEGQVPKQNCGRPKL